MPLLSSKCKILEYIKDYNFLKQEYSLYNNKLKANPQTKINNETQDLDIILTVSKKK